MGRVFVLLLIAGLSASAPREEEYFRWCGDKLNSLDQAKAMRLATELMYSCKEDIIRLDVSPLILRELKRLCIMFRACFAYGSYTNASLAEFRETYMHCIRTLLYSSQTLNPDLFRNYRANVTAILEATARCADHMVPQDVRYTLAALGFFKDFVSG